MRRSALAALSTIGGLLSVPATVAPAAAEVTTAETDFEVPTPSGSTTCHMSGWSEVRFDADAGPDGTSTISFGTSIADSQPACHQFLRRIDVVARYRREQDQGWLTSAIRSEDDLDPNGSATVPGAIVEAVVDHDVSLFDTSCASGPRPTCGPGGAALTTDPK